MTTYALNQTDVKTTIQAARFFDDSLGQALQKAATWLMENPVRVWHICADGRQNAYGEFIVFVYYW